MATPQVKDPKEIEELFDTVDELLEVESGLSDKDIEFLESLDKQRGGAFTLAWITEAQAVWVRDLEERFLT